MFLIFKFRPQYCQGLINGFFFKISSSDQILTWYGQHTFSGIVSNIFKHIDNPLFNFIIEFVQIDIFCFFLIIKFTIHVQCVSGEHACKFNIQSTFPDSQGNFFRPHIDLGSLFCLVETDGRYSCRTQRALNK